MGHAKTWLLGLLSLLLFAAGAQAKEWRGIVPLRTTRADVERLLGPPGEYGIYTLPEGSAKIHYTGEYPCDGAANCWCAAPRDTVTRIRVGVAVPMKISALKLDPRRYKKFTSPAAPHHTTYTNEEEGVTYTVDEDGEEVLHIDYYESRADCAEMMRQRGGKKFRRHGVRKSGPRQRAAARASEWGGARTGKVSPRTSPSVIGASGRASRTPLLLRLFGKRHRLRVVRAVGLLPVGAQARAHAA